MQDLNPILHCFQAAHSVLNLAWSRPGVPAMAGARIFLGTSVFKGFSAALARATDELAGLPPSKLREALAAAAEGARLLLGRLQSESEQLPQEVFDSAVNLLYFVTGAAWHLAAMEEAHVQPLESGPMNVEPFDQLCRVCGWSANAESPAEALRIATRLMQTVGKK